MKSQISYDNSFLEKPITDHLTPMHVQIQYHKPSNTNSSVNFITKTFVTSRFYLVIINQPYSVNVKNHS